MKGFDVLKVKSAVKNHNKFDLSRTHLTTMDFGQIVPLLAEETVPGDKFTIDGNYFSRLAPLTKPTYGKFAFKTVAGYVPYHMIAMDSDAWLAGKTSWEGVTPVQRHVTMADLRTFIYQNCISTAGATSANTDYTYIAANGTVTYTTFTNKGRYFVKILNALGYAVPDNVDLQTGSYYMTNIDGTKLSAYPLLAFFKLYNDYMSQSQRFNTSALSNLLNAIKYGRSVTGYYAATGQITYAGMKTLFDNLFLNYENDYFTSAWQSPNAPLAGPENLTSVIVPNSQPSAVVDDANNTSVALDAGVLTQRALDFMKSFDDWVRRNNYSGSRAVQQVYSRFGIKTSDYRDHYANVLGTDTMPVNVGDVTATADASGAPLGDYAGKGIVNGSKTVSVQCDDYGIIIILGYVTVIPMNPYGFDRKVLRNTPLDYYNPEFDGIGADPISVGEVFVNPTVTSSTYDNATFGFTERYNSYRYGRDMITGDFRDYQFSNPGSMNVWHTGRDLTAIRNGGNLVAQSSSMNTLPQTDSEYNRIFNVTSGDVDHFYLTAQFRVDAVRPMLNLNQVPKLGEGDTVVPRNGNVIS